jgi:hypothetical protein
MKKTLSVLIAATFCASAAQASVPPSAYLVKKIAEKRKTYKAVKIQSTVSEWKSGAKTGIAFQEVTVVDNVAGVLRSTAYREEGHDLYVVERKINGTPAQTLNTPFADQILFQSNFVQLFRLLVSQGVPVKSEADLNEIATEEARRSAEDTALKRWDSYYAWVIGKTQNEPQLWIQKDAFLPIRVWYPASGSQGETELQFDVRHTFGALLFPQSITYLEGPQQGLKDEVVQVQAVTPAKTRASAKTGWTAESQLLDEQTRSLIEMYYRHVR